MADPEVSPTPPPRVLVAEDDAALRRLLELRLRMDGFDVTTAQDGQEAIDAVLAADVKPDILVCDIMMPRVSGLNVCRELRGRAASHSLPIILLSAHNLDPTIEAVLELGNIGFMNKPFNATELRERIREVLAQRAGAKVE